ncbi:LOG family protein [Pedobacter cryoconitis]|uniref:Uncharacterized protein n=1 Tax=Pedobacter cryoconitis TaxID=188932 RepID=A0A327S153_9SPHI|nr:LOG family protein [Pedobacter cryoconitis]RAJ22591.1 hypothetical protein LY11_04731 [Pedobacter cryoconitis]
MNLKKNHTIKNFPIVIFGKQYHQELIDHIEFMKSNATISVDDPHLIPVTDSIEKAVALIVEKSIKQYGLRPENKVKPFKWLFERK